MRTTAKSFLSHHVDRRHAVLIVAISLSLALHALLFLFFRPATRPLTETMSDQPLSLTLSLERTQPDSVQSALRAEDLPKTSLQRSRKEQTEQAELADSLKMTKQPSAMKLLNDAIQLARRQEADNFKRTMRHKQAHELTAQDDVRLTPFDASTDSFGWTYVELGGACMTYRENDPFEQFDEPVMMYTRCRNQQHERSLFAGLKKKDPPEN